MPFIDLDEKQETRLAAIREALLERGTSLGKWSRRHGFSASTVRLALVDGCDGFVGRKIVAKEQFPDIDLQ
jgi:lambda repressor-like predicted transcriptional regulator